MSRPIPFVKVCGLARGEDVELALRLGATHLGCVLAPDSPRAVDAARAGELLGDLPSEVVGVLVFRSADPDVVLRASERAGVRTVQLHGYPEAEARRLEARGLTVLRAYDAGVGLPSLRARADRLHVLDSRSGGTGRAFDWAVLAPRAPRFCFVAGGITPENVAALLAYEPWGVDVSSGVERAPGVKDEAKLRALFEEVAGER